MPHPEEIRQLDHRSGTNTRLLSFPADIQSGFTDHRFDLETRESRFATAKAIHRDQ
jgi:hypothetical protein